MTDSGRTRLTAGIAAERSWRADVYAIRVEKRYPRCEQVGPHFDEADCEWAI